MSEKSIAPENKTKDTEKVGLSMRKQLHLTKNDQADDLELTNNRRQDSREHRTNENQT